jgi:hypothetical protein
MELEIDIGTLSGGRILQGPKGSAGWVRRQWQTDGRVNGHRHLRPQLELAGQKLSFG